MASSSDTCGNCGTRLVWARTGRPARYCSTRCRVAAHRAGRLVIDQVLDVAPALPPCRLCGRDLPAGAALGYCSACLPDLFSHAP